MVATPLQAQAAFQTLQNKLSQSLLPSLTAELQCLISSKYWGDQPKICAGFCVSANK